MKLVTARAECQRCSFRGDARNAAALAAQHYTKTGHVIEVVLTYRFGGAAPPPRANETLPFERET